MYNGRWQLGTGHGMWSHDEDGNLIYVFHNAEYEHGRYGGRDAQVRRVHWSKEGMPILDMQTAEELDPRLCWCNDGGWFLRCRLSPLNDKRGIYAEANGGNGEHVVTMREVAKAAGVSIKTVSNVVNDYEFVSQATRDKVNKAIVELGYTVNVSARNLRRGQTGIIGLAIPDLQMPYFAQLSSLVIEEAKKVGLRVIVEPTQYSRDGELEALHGSQQTMIDGLIYSPLELGQDDVERLKVDYPLVLVGERIFTDQVDHIATENVEGAKRATQYLLTTGCRRVAVVGVHPGEKVGSAALRYQGYLEALEEAGVEFDDRLVVESGMWHRSDGVRAMNALLDSGVKVDGVVALNDMLASGVMHAIQMHGLHIPDDISVVGFDNSDDSQYLSPALTSIAPGLEAVARLSVKVLKERIDGRDPNADRPGEKVFRKVTSSLVVRQSTKLPADSLVL